MNNDLDETKVVELRLDDIIPNRFQPREVFDEEELKELSDSIKVHGVIQPVIVRRLGDKYELIAGERRCKASSLAGKTTIPAIIRDIDDQESAKLSLLENLQRKNLSAIEEARTYKKILELDPEMTQEALARTMGRSQPMIANKLRLLGLPEEVQDSLIKGQISERHARSLLNIKDKARQLAYLEKIKKERLTVRELEALIKKEKEESEEKKENSEPKKLVSKEESVNSEESQNEKKEERAESSDMNNGMMNGGFNNNPYENANNYRSNFGNMGLNDYQSSIQSGMYNNIPNMNNQMGGQNTNQYVSPFASKEPEVETNNFPNSNVPDFAPNNNSTNYENYSDSQTYMNPPVPGGNEFSNNPFDEIANNSPNNNASTLGSMFDGNPQANPMSNMTPANNQENNQFISQIKEEHDNKNTNQFLPNFEDALNYDNQNAFSNQNFNNQDNFLNQSGLNNQNNFPSPMENNQAIGISKPNNMIESNNNDSNQSMYESFPVNGDFANNFETSANNNNFSNNHQTPAPFNDFSNNSQSSNQANNFINNNQTNSFITNNEGNNMVNGFSNNSFSNNMPNDFPSKPNNMINNPIVDGDQAQSFVNNKYSEPVRDFAFSNIDNTYNMTPNNVNNVPNNLQTLYDDNQGGLFNQPLNIVNVPGASTPSEPESKENETKETELSAHDNMTNSSIENENSSFEHNQEQNSSSGEHIESSTNEASDNQQASEPKKEYINLDPVKTIFDPRGAVLELKKTTDRIKQENIKMDTEEIEFDDYYQITIKIKK